MTLVVPYSWSAGDDATSARMQTLTDASRQLLGQTPVGSGTVLDFAQLRQTVGQNIASGTGLTAITFDTEDTDLANGHSTSSNTSRYTGLNPGTYSFKAGVTCASFGVAPASGLYLGARLYKNGAILPGNKAVWQGPPAYGANTAIIVTADIVLNGTTDYVELMFFQTSGSTLSVTPAWMDVRWVHA